MGETLTIIEQEVPSTDLEKIGRITVLEAFATFEQPISLDAEGRCTPTGWNVDYDD